AAARAAAPLRRGGVLRALGAPRRALRRAGGADPGGLRPGRAPVVLGRPAPAHPPRGRRPRPRAGADPPPGVALPGALRPPPLRPQRRPAPERGGLLR